MLFISGMDPLILFYSLKCTKPRPQFKILNFRRWFANFEMFSLLFNEECWLSYTCLDIEFFWALSSQYSLLLL